MRRTFTLMMLLAVLTGCSSSPSSSNEQGSCVSPQLQVQPMTAAPGTSVHVTGQWFLATCNDVVVGSRTQPPPGQPLDQVQLTLTDSAGQQHQVATAKPDPAGSISIDVILPANLPSGTASLAVPGHGQPAILSIS